MYSKKEVEAKLHDIESGLVDVIDDAQNIISKAKELELDLIDANNMVIALEVEKEEEE